MNQFGKVCLSFPPPRNRSFHGPLSSESVSEFVLEGLEVCEKGQLCLKEYGLWLELTRKIVLLNQMMPNFVVHCWISKNMSKRRSFRWKQTCGYRSRRYQYTRKIQGAGRSMSSQLVQGLVDSQCHVLMLHNRKCWHKKTAQTGHVFWAKGASKFDLAMRYGQQDYFAT